MVCGRKKESKWRRRRVIGVTSCCSCAITGDLPQGRVEVASGLPVNDDRSTEHAVTGGACDGSGCGLVMDVDI